MSADPHSRFSPELTASTESRVEPLAPVAVERFDDYAIVGKIGVGGMAEVFLALSTGPSGFRKLLVVKRVHAHLGDDPVLVQMFLDEARLAARLHHPHVIQTYEVGTLHERPFLAMEYLDGQPGNRLLRRIADRGRTFPAPLVARIIADVLDGLDYAHNATDFDGSPLNVVHRDISPHNVFIGYDGSVKVLDFGIAKAATSESSTRTGTIKGKFAYIAPEQARGETIDGRADVWSTGVSMWELLTGKRLFRRSTEVAVLQATLGDPIPLANEIQASVPPELARICARALERDVDARWPSASAMRDAIEEWLASQGREGSKSALSALMKDLFAEDIVARRAEIKACVERVASGTGSFGTLSQILPLHPSGESDAVEVSTRVAKSGARRSPIAVADPMRESPPTRAWLVPGGLLGLLLVAIVVAIVVWPRSRPAHEPDRAAGTMAPSATPTSVRSAAPSSASVVAVGDAPSRGSRRRTA